MEGCARITIDEVCSVDLGPGINLKAVAFQKEPQDVDFIVFNSYVKRREVPRKRILLSQPSCQFWVPVQKAADLNLVGMSAYKLVELNTCGSASGLIHL